MSKIKPSVKEISEASYCSVNKLYPTLQPHGLQHARLLRLLAPRVCSNSCPLSWRCYLTILSSVAPSPLPSILPSIRVFSNELALQVAVELELQQQSSKEYSELISFRIAQFDLTAVQGTLKSLLQHHNSKASILGHSFFFVAQLSQTYMTNGKNHTASTIWIFVSKVMFLLFNMLCRFVTAFLPRSKCL